MRGGFVGFERVYNFYDIKPDLQGNYPQTNMADLLSLLSLGYFPAKLPAPFSTANFAEILVNNAGSIPATFSNPKHSKPVRHSFARVGINRRLLSIPNPIVQYNLSADVVNNWGILFSAANKSTYSCSKPTVGQNTTRALGPKMTLDDLPIMRLQTRATSKFILKADISKCYPSIYTHSIPWAIHGKSFAKTHRGNQHIGNSLDRWVRKGQDDQTIGIPIGPDTSFLIAEIILNSIDDELEKYLGKVRGFRFVDEYEFGFRTRSDAESVLSILRGVLREYELELNSEKTAIIELPIRIESRWVPALRMFNFRGTQKAQATDLMTYFDLAFELSRENSKDHVLKYSIARLSPRDNAKDAIDSTNWPLLQNFLFQCQMVETGTFFQILELLIQYHQLGYDIDVNSVSEVLNTQIIQQCASNYGSEAAWSVWASIFFGITIEANAAKALSLIRDPIVALLSLDARQRGLIPIGLDTTLWESYMDAPNLYGPQWLLSYEANLKGWLPSKSNNDHVLSDPMFRFLKINGIEFYDLSKLPSAVPAGEEVDEDVFAPLFEDVFY
jgi:hypothetical protein